MSKTSPTKPTALTLEHHGIDTIPEQAKTYKPYHIITTLFGADLAPTKLFFGALPIMLGLSWWQTVGAITAGSIIGSLILAPLAIFGPKTGTNNPVSSGAHFGIAGRFIGSCIALLSAIGFIAITVWQSGDILASAASRLFSIGSDSEAVVRGVSYVVLGAIVITICIRGIHMVLRLQSKFMIPVIGTLFLLGIVAFAPHFDAGYAGKPLTQREFYIAFFISAFVVSSSMISYVVFLGDWTRYMPADAPKKSLIASAFLGGMADGLPMLWSAFVVSTYAAHAGDFAAQMVLNSPTWYLPALIVMALAGGIAQGAIGLYGEGLDTSSIVPRLNRTQATIAIGVVSVICVFLGVYVWDATNTVLGFLGILLTLSGPWAAIMVIGYWQVRGHYFVDDLQVFTRGQKGGRYWFNNGWNKKATSAWVIASIFSLLFTDATPLFKGPFCDVFGGVNLSFIISTLVGGVLYLVFILIFPTPHYVFGPKGAAFGNVDSHQVANPIEDV